MYSMNFISKKLLNMKSCGALLLCAASATSLWASDFVGERCSAFSKCAKDADFVNKYYTKDADKLDKRTHVFHLSKNVKQFQKGYEENGAFVPTETYRFSPEGYLLEFSGAKGKGTFIYISDTLNHITYMESPAVGATPAKKFKFDKNGECVEIREKNKVVLNRLFDSEGKILSMLDMKAGEKDSFIYAPGQPILCKRSRRGKDLTLPALKPIKYDRFCNALQENGGGASYKLHPDGRVKTRVVTDHSKYAETIYEYDQRGNVVAKIDKSTGMESEKTLYKYDEQDRVVCETRFERGKETTRLEYLYQGEYLKSLKIYYSGELGYEADLDEYGNPMIMDEQLCRYEYFK